MIIEVVAAIVCLLLVKSLVKWWLNPLRQIPGPPGLPFIGNTLDAWLYPDLHQRLLRQAKQYGPIYKDYTIIAGYKVHLTDPAYAKHVLVTNCKNYKRNELLRRLLPAAGLGLVTSNGKLHALQRKHLNPEFSLANIKKYLPIFNSKTCELIQLWKNKIGANDGKPIETTVLNKFSELTLDVIGLCAFGYSFNSIMGGHSKESLATEVILTANFNVLQKSFETIFPFVKIFPSKARRDLEEAENLFYGLVKKVIKTRREECKSENAQDTKKIDLLQILLGLYQNDDDETATNGLFNQVFTFMLAGHETTSITMTFTLFLLAKYPEIQEKARKEIRNVIGSNSEIQWEDIEKLKYLDYCIRESLRLYPPAIITGRETINEEKLGPYTIPANTTIFVGIGALQQHPQLWEDPTTFKPERFEAIDDMKDPSLLYRFLPFSRGPRMCIGYKFAQVELKVALALILASFSFKLGKDQSDYMGTKQTLTLKPSPSPVIEAYRFHEKYLINCSYHNCFIPHDPNGLYPSLEVSTVDLVHAR